jgi:serine/threonine protein kinase
VVDAVFYLDQQGITHRDIKDENLVISKDLHVCFPSFDPSRVSTELPILEVKLIDFGSAIITDPTQPRPYHTLFFGTTAYAAPEVLLKKPYQAPPAEIWTLGVLLSFLLTGTSAVPSEADAVQGRIVLNPKNEAALSAPCLSLLRRCLELDPVKRADIHEVRTHPWLVDDHHRGSSAE